VSKAVATMATGADESIPIVHLDLDTGCEGTVGFETAEALVVFWVNQRPIGQIYVRADGGYSLSIADLAREAVDQRVVLAARSSEDRLVTARISLVICTRDRPDDLARCLASLAEQTRPPDQVLVVDNASSDHRTRAVAEAAGVDYVYEPRPGLDIARNAGARAATGDLVLYTDDDVVLHPRWVERIAAAFDAADIMVVTGLVLPAELDTRSQQVFEKHWSLGRGFRRLDFDREFFARHRAQCCPTWEIGAGANMAVRKAAFAAVGLFDERLDVGAAGCAGDSEYWYRVLAAGWRCRYEPSAVVFHHHRRTLDALAGQILAYMRGHVAALLVQFERSGHWGNLRRALIVLPARFAVRWIARLVRRRDGSNCLLGQEIRGSLAGVMFYLRAKRPTSSSSQP
jgi:GT2 family glycosyltransferase